MNAVRSWHADAEREAQRSRADAIITVLDTGAPGPAAKARATKAVEIEGRSRGSTGSERVIATRVVCECMADTIYAQHHITKAQWEAATFFRRRYLLGYRAASVTAGYGERVGGGAWVDEPARITDARADLAALAKVLSMLQWSVVESVCGHDMKVGDGRLRHLRDGLDLVGAWREVGRAEV